MKTSEEVSILLQHSFIKKEKKTGSKLINSIVHNTLKEEVKNRGHLVSKRGAEVLLSFILDL